MTLEELKIEIENNEISDTFKIFKYADNQFLPNQFLTEICSRSGCMIKRTASIFNQTSSALSLVFDNDSDINVVIVDEFSEESDNYDDLKNTIVVCQKINKKIQESVKEYVIEFPKLLEWQIIDYMKYICPGLNEQDYTWLYSATTGDIYRIINELDKLLVFEESERIVAFDRLKNDPASDLFSQSILDLSEAIATNNRKVLYDYLLHSKYLDYDPIALANILLKKYKNIAYVCLGSGLTAEQLGMQQKTFNGIKYYNKGYTADKVYKMIKFLSMLDSQLKNNKLDCSKDTLISYIISKMLA